MEYLFHGQLLLKQSQMAHLSLQKLFSNVNKLVFFVLFFVAWIPHTVMAEANPSLEILMNKLNKQWSKQKCSLYTFKGWFVEIELVCLWLLQKPIVYFIKHNKDWTGSLNKGRKGESGKDTQDDRKTNDEQRQNKWQNKFLALAELLKSQQPPLNCSLVHLVADCPLQSY